jgi:type II secretory pathway component PulF
MPLLGRGFVLLVTTRFARTCALLLRGGLTMVETVELAGKATGSAWLSGQLSKKADDIRHGESLSVALAGVPVINQTLTSWVKAGEAAGDLPGLFTHAADRYRQLWANYIQRSVTIVEPVLIIVVAVFVLVIALAILLPILGLNQQLG